jgi:hypothetical protein
VADDILNEIWCSALAADVELNMPCSKCVACRAADEIERLRAERDGERALADRLAAALKEQGSPTSNWSKDRVLLAYEEARRG